MLTYIVAFALSCVCSLGLTPLLRVLAHRLQLVDVPTEQRKVHTQPTPRVGGIAIALSFFVPVLALFMWDNKISLAVVADPLRVTGLIVGAGLASAVGLWDDLRGISPIPKLSLQLGVAAFAYYCGYQLHIVSLPGVGLIDLGPLSLPITLLWIAGLMNAINLIDGLDGLAAGVSLVAVTTLFVLGVVGDKAIVALTAVALAGSLVGFLRHNFNPASIFMGDSGSLFLGFVLAVTGIAGSTKSSTVVALLVPVVALGLPLVDTSWTMVRRYIGGRPIFAADRAHIHHRLLDMGFSHRNSVLALYAVALGLAAAGLALTYASNEQAAVILVATVGGLVTFGRLIGFVTLSGLGTSWRYGRRRQKRLRQYLDASVVVVQAIRRAESADDAVAEVLRIAELLDVDYVAVSVERASETGEVRPVHAAVVGALDPAGTHQSVRCSFVGPGSVRCAVEYAWHCDAVSLQMPERAVYDWVAKELRERVEVLTSPGFAEPRASE